MPTAEIREIIPAPADAVFELIHDYRRRLEWDTLLQEAYLEPEFGEACRGAVSVCRGRSVLGIFALRTRYVSFDPGKVAAVELLNKPPLFDSFAASIRHFPVDDTRSEVVYKVNFAARPPWLRPILHPLMKALLVWETRKRLKSLRSFYESRGRGGTALAAENSHGQVHQGRGSSA